MNIKMSGCIATLASWLVLFGAIILTADLTVGAGIEIYGGRDEDAAPTSRSVGGDSNRSHAHGDMWSMAASMGFTGSSVEASGLESAGESGFKWRLDLDDQSVYRLYWAFNYSQNAIYFKLRLGTDAGQFRPEEDLFGLGFSRDGQSLNSSDFCLLWIGNNKQWRIKEAWTDAEGRLKLTGNGDSKSHCQQLNEASTGARKIDNLPKHQQHNMKKHQHHHHHRHRQHHQRRSSSWGSRYTSGGEETRQLGDKSAEYVEVNFWRPLDKCDGRVAADVQNYVIDNGTSHLVWFSLRGPLVSIDSLNLAHLSWPRDGDRGMRRVQLLVSQPAMKRRPASGGLLRTTDAHNGASGGLLDGDNNNNRGGEGHLGGDEIEDDEEEEEHGNEDEQDYHEDDGFKSDRKLEIRMNNFKVPSRETTYWCRLFKLPNRLINRRHHITRYEALIEPGESGGRPEVASKHVHRSVVHHMELFNCVGLSGAESNELEHLVGWEGECGTGSGVDSPIRKCRRVLLAWAMGARPLEYPEQVGQPVGGSEDSPYVMLEVHYNNPSNHAHLVDSSGLKFHYTSRLRQYEAGILEVGLEYGDKNSIPPGVVAPLVGHCVAECTRAAWWATTSGLDSSKHRNIVNLSGVEQGKQITGRETDKLQEGIYVFAGQLHTHLAGVASWTEQVRGGQVIRELQRDDHYSPHFQEIRLLPEVVHLAPGDSLLHYCLYDTRSRSNITLGGYATSDEMCVTYLHYYPRQQLEVCKSSVDSGALNTYFKWIKQREGQLGVDPNRKSVSENYRSIDWSSQRRRRELLQFYQEAPLSIQCNRSDGRRFPGYWDGLPVAKILSLDSVAFDSVTSKQNITNQSDKPPFVDRWRQVRDPISYRGKGWLSRHAQCLAV